DRERVVEGKRRGIGGLRDDIKKKQMAMHDPPRVERGKAVREPLRQASRIERRQAGIRQPLLEGVARSGLDDRKRADVLGDRDVTDGADRRVTYCYAAGWTLYPWLVQLRIVYDRPPAAV